MLTSSALVLMMTIPGLFLFYGGLVRAKNTLGTMMHSFIIVALISIQWVLWGYSLAFGPDKGGIIGGLEWIGLRGGGAPPNMGHLGVRPARPLGLGRGRVAAHPGGAGLRGRHRRAHLVRRLRSGGGPRHRQAQGVRASAHAPAQPAHDGDGRGAPVVRLVRLQRGERT